MKKLFLILLILTVSLAVLLCSCNGSSTDTGTDTDSDVKTSDSATDKDSDKTADSDKKDTNTDTSSGVKPKPEAPTYETPIEHNLKVENSVKLDVFDQENTFGNEGNTLDYTSATVIDVSQLANNKTYNIVRGGVYRLCGKTENGQILINLKDATNKNVVLVLDNLEMKYSGTKSVIYAEKCESVKIVIPENTTTTLTDTANNLEKGVIHVRSSNLTIDGQGTLNLNANASKSRGIFNTKTLTIDGGIYNITTAYSHGIQGEQELVINGGTFTINSAKSGLKTGDFDEDVPTEAVKGVLTVNGGSINIHSKTNGISAYGTVNIVDGRIDINSDSDGIDVAEEAINISGGIVVIYALNNGIKCDTDVSVSGTSNVKIMSGNDGIDSVNANVSTSGIVYIKTNVNDNAFVENADGTYIWKNNRYQEVDPAKYPNEKKFILESCKGIKVDGKITVVNATLGIDAYEDSIDGSDFEISSGKVVLFTQHDGVEVSGNVTISGVLEVMYSNKGIKAPNITVNESGVVTVISTSDAIKSALVTVNGGNVFLFEKLDVADGRLVVNNGTVIAVSSTKEAANAETAWNDLSISDFEFTENAVYGNWLRITDGEKSVVLRLTKSFVGKMSVTCISDDIDSGSYKIELGTYQVGEKINNFVYVDGEFTSVDSFEMTLQ